MKYYRRCPLEIAFSKAVKKSNKPKSFFNNFLKRNKSVSVLSYSATMAACARMRQASNVMSLHRDMKSKGIDENIFTFNSMLSVAKDVVAVNNIITQMNRKHIDPTAHTICSVIHTLCKEEYYAAAREIFHSIQGRFTMSSQFVAAIIPAMSSVDEALSLVRLYPVGRKFPDIGPALYRNCTTESDVIRVDDFLEKEGSANFFLESTERQLTKSRMIAFSNCGSHDKVLKLFDGLQKPIALDFSTVVLNSFIKNCPFDSTAVSFCIELLLLSNNNTTKALHLFLNSLFDLFILTADTASARRIFKKFSSADLPPLLYQKYRCVFINAGEYKPLLQDDWASLPRIQKGIDLKVNAITGKALRGI